MSKPVKAENKEDLLRKILMENPDVLKGIVQDEIRKANIKKGSVLAYRILGTEVKPVHFKKVNGTRIENSEVTDVLHYIVKVGNNSTVSIPEYELKNYNINPDIKEAFVDEDGLSEADKEFALRGGAF
jgi:hypothetical protein